MVGKSQTGSRQAGSSDCSRQVVDQVGLVVGTAAGLAAAGQQARWPGGKTRAGGAAFRPQVVFVSGLGLI